MAKWLLVLMLGVFGVSMIGCEASGEVDTDEAELKVDTD